MKKRYLALAMALTLVAASTISAEEVTTSGSAGTVPVTLNAEETTFSATVPLNLTVEQLSDGTVVTATNAQITNDSPLGGIKVTDVTITGATGFTLVASTDDFQTKKVNTKEFAFVVNGEEANLDTGKLPLSTTSWPVINANTSLPITYNAKLPAQATAIADKTIGQVVFTIGWDLAD